VTRVSNAAPRAVRRAVSAVRIEGGTGR